VTLHSLVDIMIMNLYLHKTITSFTRQGGANYTHTSLLDGFYIKTSNTQHYLSYTNIDTILNSDHFLVHLHIPHNTLLARPIPPSIPKHPRILNPIPLHKIETFNVQFLETNTILINNLTAILLHDNLNETQWPLTCTLLNSIIQIFSQTIQKTCTAPPPILPLTSRTAQQGGYLPRKLQKLWKIHLHTYHFIRKAIYITQHTPNWYNHLLILNLHNHKPITIPKPPEHPQPHQEWLNHISSLAKTAKINARKITTIYPKMYTQSTI
jgi:hypothetical protein